jgi:DNA polymerase-3 subunit delta'
MDSKIVISNDIEKAFKDILSLIDSKLIKIFSYDELKVDDSKSIISEAYIAEEREKYIIIKAKSFRVEAQNALLKLLEEPPRNIIFIIIAQSKSLLLPTIRSRLQIELRVEKKESFELGLDLKNMELEEIFDFIKEHKSLKRHELKALIERLFIDAIKRYKIALNESELELFEKSLVLADLHTRSEILLSTLLLTLYHARGR